MKLTQEQQADLVAYIDELRQDLVETVGLEGLSDAKTRQPWVRKLRQRWIKEFGWQEPLSFAQHGSLGALVNMVIRGYDDLKRRARAGGLADARKGKAYMAQKGRRGFEAALHGETFEGNKHNLRVFLKIRTGGTGIDRMVKRRYKKGLEFQTKEGRTL